MFLYFSESVVNWWLKQFFALNSHQPKEQCILLLHTLNFRFLLRNALATTMAV